ncbi:MAG: AMP-binding protein, partial [Pseudomonadota bacterium]
MAFLSELKSNWTTVTGMRRTMKLIDPLAPDATQLVPDDLEDTVDRFSKNVAIRFNGEIWTYGEMDAYANKVAHWALGQGLKPGDCVALFMENRPEYVPIWYGLSKVGVVTALINNNLNGDALAHCVNISGAKHVVYGARQDEAIDSVDGKLTEEPSLWTLGGKTSNARANYAAALEAQSDERPDRSIREDLRGGDLAMYVYTSGTTGLPKAARLT